MKTLKVFFVVFWLLTNMWGSIGFAQQVATADPEELGWTTSVPFSTGYPHSLKIKRSVKYYSDAQQSYPVHLFEVGDSSVLVPKETNIEFYRMLISSIVSPDLIKVTARILPGTRKPENIRVQMGLDLYDSSVPTVGGTASCTLSEKWQTYTIFDDKTFLLPSTNRVDCISPRFTLSGSDGFMSASIELSTIELFKNGVRIYYFDVSTGIKEILPVEFSLSQNYPNPFNPSTTIMYTIPSSQFVNLKVYDMLGKEVATLVNEFKQAGSYNSTFSIIHSQLPSGIYFYTLRAGNYLETRKMILMK